MRFSLFYYLLFLLFGKKIDFITKEISILRLVNRLLYGVNQKKKRKEPMRPLKFNALLKQVIWGGERIISYKRLHRVLPKVGESWEISDLPGEHTLVSDGEYKGKTLSELISLHKDLLVGKKCYDTFGARFPLLIKFIDAASDLSIQVHPNDSFAHNQGLSCGKTEMWYIVDAKPGSTLVSGLKEPLTKGNYVKAIEDGSFLDKLRVYPVQKGDCFYIPSGQVHSIGSGILLMEVQQASDITYRIFDYDRIDVNGKKRELHTENAMQTINLHDSKDYRVEYKHKADTTVELVKCPYFTTSLCEINKSFYKDLSKRDSFTILTAFDGECTITNDTGDIESLHAGESILIPACTKYMSIKPIGKECKFLEVFYP